MNSFDGAQETNDALIPYLKDKIMAEINSMRLFPATFFVAWNGVLTLAFQGFPETIVSWKAETRRSLNLPKENPGSCWPKITLAICKDDVSLSLEDLRELSRLCIEFGPQLVSYSLWITTLSYVRYSYRSLEEISCRQDFPLIEKDDSFVNPDHRAFVDSILREMNDLDGYYENVRKPGNRSSHYRSTCQEMTLVAFIGEQFTDIIDCFRSEVDAKLPGRYDWIDKDARHLTIMSLNH